MRVRPIASSFYVEKGRRDFSFSPFTKPEKPAIMSWLTDAPVAQWIEHRIPVPRVGGSSPFRCTKQMRGIPIWVSLSFVSPSGREGTRKAGPGVAGVKSVRWTLFRPWESPWIADGRRYACWQRSITRIPIWVSLSFVSPSGRKNAGRIYQPRSTIGCISLSNACLIDSNQCLCYYIAIERRLCDEKEALE